MLGETVAMLMGKRVIRRGVVGVSALLFLNGCSTFRPRAGDLPFPERPQLTWSMQGEAYCLGEPHARALDYYLRQIEALREASYR